MGHAQGIRGRMAELYDVFVDMVVVRGTGEEAEALLHRAHPVRVWNPETLAQAFSGAGFRAVAVSARMDDPSVPATTEDVFVHATAPPP